MAIPEVSLDFGAISPQKNGHGDFEIIVAALHTPAAETLESIGIGPSTIEDA